MFWTSFEQYQVFYHKSFIMREKVSLLFLVLCVFFVKSENEINDWRPVFLTQASYEDESSQQILDPHSTTTIIRHPVPQSQALTVEAREPILTSFISTYPKNDRCAADKFAFDEGAYLSYRAKIPNMKEFTLCMWTRFYNHSTDHPLFSYSGN